MHIITHANDALWHARQVRVELYQRLGLTLNSPGAGGGRVFIDEREANVRTRACRRCRLRRTKQRERAPVMCRLTRHTRALNRLH